MVKEMKLMGSCQVLHCRPCDSGRSNSALGVGIHGPDELTPWVLKSSAIYLAMRQ